MVVQSHGRPRTTFLSPQQSESPDPIKEFQIPTPDAGPLAIIATRNNTFWFTEFNASQIGEFFEQNSSFKEFPIPEPGARPAALALDNFGRIWFSDQSGPGSIWMFDPSTGVFQQYKTLTAHSTPLFVLIDKQNNVWFAESTANMLGELIYPNYTMKEYPLPTPNSEPVELAFGQNDSIIWITETNSGKIAEFNALKQSYVEFTPPPSERLVSPVGIVYDSSGNVWVSDHGGSSVDELIPSNSTFRKYPTSLPNPALGYANSAVATLAIDSQGRLWFVEHFSNKVGRLDPRTNTMNEFVIPTYGAYSVQNSLDSLGNFWFTEYTGNIIGMIQSNATSPIQGEVMTTALSIGAGQKASEKVKFTNTLDFPVQVTLNSTSTFSETGQTSQGEVSFNATTLLLPAGGSSVVSASITPEISLPGGIYSIGIVATYGNDSSIAISFFSVSESISGLIDSYAQEILLVSVAALVGLYLMIRRRLSLKRGHIT